MKHFKFPSKIHVSVKKGESGSLLVDLPELDIFTEADNLNDLFYQVNDLIYTYFDIPKKEQNNIRYIPSLSAQQLLIKIANEPMQNMSEKFDIKPYYNPSDFNNHVACA